MKIKLLIAAFTLGIAIAGSTAANAGTRQNYASLDNKTPTALCTVKKDNNTNGSYVTYRSGVGVNAQVRNTVFKVDYRGKKLSIHLLLPSQKEQDIGWVHIHHYHH